VNNLIPIIATAILSSLLTLGVFFAVFKLFVEKRIETRLEILASELEKKLKQNFATESHHLLVQFREEVQQGFKDGAAETLPWFRSELTAGFTETAKGMLPQFRQELSDGFKETAESLLPQFRQEVRQGFVEAGEELLPALRENIEDNIKNTVLSLAGGDIVDKAAKTVLKTGSSLVETGLFILRGQRTNDDKK